MFEVTEKASSMINKFLEKQEGPSAIRIRMQRGWGNPAPGMALDEPREKDFTFTDRGITFAVDKKLFEKAKPIYIDFVESARKSGFKIKSRLATGDGRGDSCGC